MMLSPHPPWTTLKNGLFKAPMKSPVSVFDPSAFPLIHQPVSGPMRRDLRRVPRSKRSPREFIGGFERLAIACLHGDADKRSGPGHPNRTPNPHRAAVGRDRAAAPNCRAGAPAEKMAREMADLLHQQWQPAIIDLGAA